jgi:transglutaminase-like putative cysteine protease
VYRTGICLLIGLAVTAAPAHAEAAADAAAVTVRWQVVTADGRKVGHVTIHRVTESERIEEREQIEIELGPRARRVKYRVNLETVSGPDGALRRMAREVITQEAHTRVEARAIGDALEITQRAGGEESMRRIEGAARGLRTEEAAHSWLASVGAGGSPAPFVYRAWDPVKLAVVGVELTARPGDAVVNVERRVHGAQETASRLLADARGVVVREILRMDSFTLERSEATEAQARAPNDAFDHRIAALTPSPYRIPASEMRAKLRYRLDNGGRRIELPAGAGQRTWSEGQTTWIQVCASCGADPVPLDAGERAAALAPSRWLESAAPQIATLAARLTRRARDPTDRMRRLTAFVRGHMDPRVDMLGYGTALDALRTKRGDCTEYAVLLAALGRAAGVPTRIAIGRVYARRFEGARDVFVPHAWVHAWTGTGWESFDAGTGSFDSTHLAFALSYDGNPLTHAAGLALSRELRLVGAARVAARAAPASNN